MWACLFWSRKQRSTLRYISDVNDGELREVIGCGLVSMGPSLEAVTKLDMVVIVLTPLDASLAPDLQYIESVTHELARNLRPGQLVCLESTTYPGTTRR